MTSSQDPTEHSVLSHWLGGWLEDDALRSMSDVPRRGLDAATQIVDRLTHLFDGVTAQTAHESAPAGPTPGGHDGGERRDDALHRLQGDMTRMFDIWSEAMVDMIDMTFDAIRSSEGRARPTSMGRESIVIGPVVAGGRGTAEIYADGTAGQGLLTYRAGTFESSTGGRLPATTVTLDPTRRADGDRRPVTVFADVPPRTPAGRYHGFVFAEGVDTATIIVEIQVVEMEDVDMDVDMEVVEMDDGSSSR
jgi:hypothetical protein